MSDDFDALARIGPAFMDGYIVVDTDRKITNFNPAYTQMLDLRAADRKKLLSMHCCEPLRLEACREGCVAQVCMQKNAAMRLQEIRAMTAENREFVLEITALPLKGANGKVNAALLVQRDVTDERRDRKSVV